MNSCEGPGPTVTASTPSASTFTEPLASAVTVKILGMSPKWATTVASAVTEPTTSAQMLAPVPIPRAQAVAGVPPPDSAQRLNS